LQVVPGGGGNTEALTVHALKAIAEEGLDTGLVSLAGLDIRGCNACNVCHKKERCPIDDDFSPVYLKMKEVDGIIIASPVYYGSATALVKGFMERAGYISRRHGEPFRGKVGGSLAVGRRAGHIFTLAQLNFWFQSLGLVVPGSSYRNMAFGRDKGEVSKDEEGMGTAWNFGKNAAWVIKSLRG